MTPDSESQVQEIARAAARLPLRDRAAFLDRACAQDQALRAAVARLLLLDASDSTSDHSPHPTDSAPSMAFGHRHASRTGARLASPPDDRADYARLVGRHIGTYSIKRVIASGGMGTVYEAIQESPRRVVALKVMRPGLASASALRRFQYEAQILARLRHPGIAQIYEAGVHEDDAGPAGGVPYFAMEYIPNARPITTYAEEEKLPNRGRVTLFRLVCEAVHHGHQKGIIHRDLKPTNILVDSSGQPKVIDFGVARATDSDLAVTTLQTDVGQLIGTLRYMSPEQCSADPHDLDTRSDVYALGVVLYELLCGRPPYDLSRVALHEAARVIREQPPTRPSTISRILRGDVETITLKALEKDRKRRYQSALDLEHDLRCYLDNQPVSARPPSFVYQARMFARRHRAVSIVGTTALLALTLGVVGTTSGYLKARSRAESERVAKENAQEAEIQAKRAGEAAAAATREAVKQKEAAEFEAYASNIAAADASMLANEPKRMRARLDACPEQIRAWEWHYLNAAADTSMLAFRSDNANGITSATLSPDSSRLITTTYDSARLWDATTGSALTLLGNFNPRLTSFSLDGKRVVLGSANGWVRSWDLDPPHVTAEYDFGSEQIQSLAFSRDGSRILITSSTAARVWDSSLIDVLPEFRDGDERRYPFGAFSADGGRFALNMGHGLVRVLDSPTRTEIASFRPGDAIRSIAFSPDTSHVLTVADGVARLWKGVSGDPGHVLHGPEEYWDHAARFSRDGTRVVTSSADGTANVWDASSGARLAVLSERSQGVVSSAFSPDGRSIVTACADGTARLWDVATGQLRCVLRGHLDLLYSAEFSSDGARILTTSRDGTARIWDAATQEKMETFEYLTKPDGHYRVGIDAAGEPCVIAFEDGSLRLRRAESGRESTVRLELKGAVVGIDLGPRGDHFVTLCADRTVRVWDAHSGTELSVIHGHSDDLEAAAFSPDGTRLVTSSADDTARVWDAATSAELAVLRGHRGNVWSSAFSPDGTRVVTASADGTARVWDTLSGAELCVLRGHSAHVWSAVFSPDGARVLTVSEDKTARLWDAGGGSEVAVLAGHERGVLCGSYSPDGQRIVTASDDQTARVWDVDRGMEMIVLRDLGLRRPQAAFSPDGSRVIVSDRQGAIRVFNGVSYGVRRQASRAHDGPASSSSKPAK